MRVLLALVALAAVAVACSDAPTNPTTESAGVGYPNITYGCPAAFTQSQGTIVSGSEADLADDNRDGIVCFLDVIHPQDPTDIRRSYIDNNVPNRVADCPGEFQSTPAGGSPVDRNEDGSVCVATRPNGNQVTIDNHFSADPRNVGK